MREVSYAEALREAMSQEMRTDPTVFVMGEDIGVYGGAFGVTAGMLDEFGPERVRDTPISEAALVGTGAGAAVVGMRPIVEIMFSDFLGIAMDQLVNQTAKIRYMFGGRARVPLVIRTPEGAGTGAAAQHSQSLEAWYAHVPGLKTVTVSSPYDAKGLLISAIREDNPVVFLEQKLLYGMKGDVPEDPFTIPIGKADVKREGTDLTIVTYGRMVWMSMEVAAEMSTSENSEIEVLDLRTLRPMDTDAVVSSVSKTGRLLIVHEATQFGGFGGEIAATIADSDAFYYLDAPIRRVAGFETPIPYNPKLEGQAVPTKERIRDAASSLLGVRG
jgi:pyruvate dehydrogenase E1 component beta subunit